MNALLPFAPILTLSLGSLGYLVAGSALERTRLCGAFAFLLVLASAVLLFSTGDVGSGEGLAAATAGGTGSYGLLFNPFTRFLGVLACAGAGLSIVGAVTLVGREIAEMTSEYYFLLLTALCGALLMVFASDMLTLFIGVEVASLALYCLCGARITRPASSESALKYFLMGSFSSAFLLYGIALWYGATGSLSIEGPALLGEATRSDGSMGLLLLAHLMFMVGLAFKLGVAPFHFWTPDVYQGAPTSVTAFMSCVVKIAALGVLIRLGVTRLIIPEPFGIEALLWALTVLTMTVGNFAALQQQSVRRMLAYSSVAQAGYMLIGLVAFDGHDGGALDAALYYLVGYTVMTVGAFLALGALGPDTDALDDLAGLGRRSPFVGVCITIIFLGLAGLPPGMAGLIGKVLLFSAAMKQELYGLVVVAALNSALACAYYVRVPATIWFRSAAPTAAPIRPALLTWATLAVCAAAVVLLGVFPEPVLRMVTAAVAAALEG